MISFLGLVCGVLASLALGVLIAQAVCVSMFRLFRIHALQAAARTAAKPVLKVAGQA